MEMWMRVKIGTTFLFSYEKIMRKEAIVFYDTET